MVSTVIFSLADPVGLWMLLVLLPLPSCVPAAAQGPGPDSESPVSQPLGGDRPLPLAEASAGSLRLHACHPCGWQPQTHHGVEFSPGFPSSSSSSRQPAASVPTTTNIRTTKMVFISNDPSLWRGSGVTSWLHFAADDLVYRVTPGGTPDMLPGCVGRRWLQGQCQ